MQDGSNRTQVIQIGSSTALINSYLPCRGKYSKEEFKNEVDQIQEIIHKYRSGQIILVGDMNVDIHKQIDDRAQYFKKFLENNNIEETEVLYTATYLHHDNKSKTKIDYIFIDKAEISVEEPPTYEILVDDVNTSPHKALLLKLPGFVLNRAKGKKEEKIKILKWNKTDINLYQETLATYLDDVEDIIDIDASIKLLTSALQTATEIAVPSVTVKENYKPPPWNENIKILLKRSKKAHYNWKEAGRPGPESELFIIRKKINRELRREQRIQSAMIRKEKQDEIMGACFTDNSLFYKLIRKQRRTSQVQTNELEVNGTVYKDELLPGWTEHFCSLSQPLNDSHFDEEYNNQIKEEIKVITSLCDRIHSCHVPITTYEIEQAISRLKNRKAKDETNLVSEHLKLGGNSLLRFLKLIINNIVMQKEIPDVLKSGILHPIHKKGKPITQSGNYRGITIIKIIGKILDILMAIHQEVAIPTTCNHQFSFTKERSPSHATLLVNEAIAHCRDAKIPLFTATMDIQKAFDVVPHDHLLRKLYIEGLKGRWWSLKRSAYTDMTGKVIWKKELGESFKILQGTRQGGNGSTQDFKLEIKTVSTSLVSSDVGLHIGTCYIGIITCADDVILLATDEDSLQFMVKLVNELMNKERMKIHPQKSSISILGITDTEMEFFKEVQPWQINGIPLPITPTFTHLGIEYDFSSNTASLNRTVEARLQKGRNTTYALMGAGLHGTNGINPIISWHIYKVYVQPRVLYSLESMIMNPMNVNRLEKAMRRFLKNVQSLPGRASNAATYILLGALPTQAIIEQQQVRLLLNLRKNPLFLNLIIRQLAVKKSNSHSWFTMTQKLLQKYELPSMLEFISSEEKEEVLKEDIKTAVATFWKKDIERDAKQKSSLKYLNTTFQANESHLLWRSTNCDSRDVRRAIIKAKLVTGTYTLQYNRKVFNQTVDNICPLCSVDVEDTAHFVTVCKTLDDIRNKYLKEVYDAIPYVYQNHPAHGWDVTQLTQLILDPTHDDVVSLLPLCKEDLQKVENASRLLCFNLHRERAQKMGYRY